MPVQILSIKKSKDLGTTWVFGGESMRYGLSKLIKQ